MHAWVRKSVDLVCYVWRWFVVVGLVWLCQTSTVLAQAEEEEKQKNYVPVYMIILFALGLSLLIACRSARRDDKIRRD